MLKSHGTVSENQHRLAFHFEVAVPHCHRGFFVAARDKFRLRIASVVHHGFLKTPKRGARIRAHVLKPEVLEDVDHEVGARAVRGLNVHLRGWGGFLKGSLGCSQSTGTEAAMAAAFERKLRRPTLASSDLDIALRYHSDPANGGVSHERRRF